MKKILIAGTSSGAGKTTITIALMRTLADKGYKIAPFKTGPDYIDPKFHSIASGAISHNLDTFLNSAETVKYLFDKNSTGKDIAVIEGVMGLYDGSGADGTGSSAHLSKILNAPVILIADAKSVSESISASLLGFKLYDPDVKIGGVILNNIVNDEFYQYLKIHILQKTGLNCIGYFPKSQIPELGERHLGLVPADELDNIEEYINILSETAEKTIDFDALENIFDQSESDFEYIQPIKSPYQNLNLRIGIARDKAFNFYYEDNLQLMRESGIQLVDFSLLKDKQLPDNVDGLYIGGGFPEVFAGQLSKNKSMLDDVKTKLENGMGCYAECGGLMYLTKSITGLDGESFDAAGFFNARSVMTKKLQNFGYIEVEYENVRIKAHEFHHSLVVSEKDFDYSLKYKITKYGKDKSWTCGLSKKNVMAGYPHIHFYSNLDFFRKIVDLYKRGKQANFSC